MDTAAPSCSSRDIREWTLSVLPGSELPVGAPAALAGLELPGSAPGCVHTDLLPHGLVSDVAVEGVEERDAWVMRTGWRYRTTIEPPTEPWQHAVLRFEGVDTFASVRVNGEVVAESSNMFRTLEVDVAPQLAAGPIDVEVDLQPAAVIAEQRDAANPLPRPDEYRIPYPQVRKMACSFGWDWGPSTATAGLWRPVRLVTWSTARLTDVRITATAPAPGGVPLVDAEVAVAGQLAVAGVVGIAGEPGAAGEAGVAGGGAVRVEVSVTGPGLDRPAAATVDLTGATAGGQAGDSPGAPIGEGGRAAVRLEVPGGQLWHPVGLGDQPLYQVSVRLLGPRGELLDRAVRRVGFRAVNLVQQPDSLAGPGADQPGRSFEVHVNGERVWIRGLNWIPDDPFPQRISRQRLRTRIEQAVDTGANLLRVWGGGIFESDDFYDICDELGVLVWQDFLFACAAYDESPATVEQIRGEVRDNVRRLRHRASLIMWCGCNENLWAYVDWSWRGRPWQDWLAGGKGWGSHYYGTLLPQLLAELDGTRPYIPGSPFTPGPLPDQPDAAHPNDPTQGTMHLWDVWNELDYAEYERHFPRFAAEFGYQAPASWPTLARAVGAEVEDLQADDPRLDAHQKALDGAAKLRAGLARHWLSNPKSGPSWYYATQLLQARAVRVGIGHYRSRHDQCSGTIWWQHNDCWPAISWSIVDVAGRYKLSWYAMRENYAPQAAFLAADPVGPAGIDGVRLVLVNDADLEWTVDLALSGWSQTGEASGAGSLRVTVPARGCRDVAAVDVLDQPADAAIDLLVCDAVSAVTGSRALPGPAVRTTRWLTADLDLRLTDPALEVTATASRPDRAAVTVRAQGLARDLSLLAELLVPDAAVDRQLLTLLPGETATFTVTGPEVGAISAARWAEVLWHDARLAQ